ncbi:MAG: nucleoside recognition protein [Hungatella sp.]|nr:nucleoside recognition protein [Hungatella sp.]
MKKSVLPALSIVVLFLMLTHPALSFEGARNGLLLWYQTVVPTLLPFMICSNVIVSLNGIRLMTAPVRPLLKSMFRLSDAGCYVLVSGLLCGYPMGAKTCGEFVRQGTISPAEGRYLLSVSNHPSPMFLLGFAASLMDPSVSVPVFLTAVYLPVLPLALLSRNVYAVSSSSESTVHQTQPHLSFDESMTASFEIMIKIGGYIMLFSILASFIGRLSFLSSPVQALLLGMVEITTGIRALSRTFSGTLQGLFLCMAAVFGGTCGLFQTRSVLAGSGLSLSHYILWKFLHMVLAAGVFLSLSALL